MGERGVSVDHSTLNRGVSKDTPEIETQFRTCARPMGKSWRLDESVPRVAQPSLAMPQFPRKLLPKFPTPLVDCLAAHSDSTLSQEIFHVLKAEAKTAVKPDRIRNNLGRKSIAVYGEGWVPIAVEFAASLANLTVPRKVNAGL